ncbi:sensor histidine kinase [Allorhizocola rhizosphaerae]|uniref:sensor histidine kinase n=1 Tax=Allorhizocola rhizosphaerae TaxID=1872709 RepID=UPI001B8B57AF|nr:histidine kinase [Allorhizocola rhizosphaerae]
MEEQLGVAAIRWVTRITWRIAPLVLGFAVFLGTLTVPGAPPTVVIGSGYVNRIDPIVLVAAAVVCGLVTVFARRWLLPLLVVAAVVWLALSAFPIIVIASYYAAVRLTRRRTAIIYLSLSTALVLIPLGAEPIVGIVAVCVLIGLPYVVGLWVNARRQVIAALQERAERLEAEQSARSEQARQEERTRIAREMHDVVAHRVALMVLHAGALEVNAPDERLAGEAALIRTTGREALTELRQVLGVLRTEEALLAPQPDLSELPSLLDRTRAAGVPVEFRLEGAGRELPTVVQRTAYRVVQEALTNVVKHAGGAPTTVTLRYSDTTLDVRVDNGPPTSPPERMPGSGLGLIGLRERVALLYGRLESRSRLDGGFTVSAVLPASPSEVPA